MKTLFATTSVILLILFHEAAFGQTGFWEKEGLLHYGIGSPTTVISSGTLYISCDGGIYKSSDDGLNWSRDMLGLPAGEVARQVTAGPNKTVFVGLTSCAVMRSTDDGRTWEKKVVSASDTNAIGLVCPTSNGGLMVGTASGNVYRSTDNGNTWTNVAIPTFQSPHSLGILTASPQGEVFAVWSCFSILASPGAFRSTDLGNTWIPLGRVPTPATIEDIPYLKFHPSGAIYCATNEHHSAGIIYRSTDDGDSWTQVFQVAQPLTNVESSHPLATESYIYGLAIDSTGTVYASLAATHGDGTTIVKGLYKLRTGNDIWELIPVDFMPKALSLSKSGTLFAGDWTLVRSEDMGTHWETSDRGLGNTQVACLSVDPVGHMLASGPNYLSVFYSGDQGLHWMRTLSPPSEYGGNYLTGGWTFLRASTGVTYVGGSPGYFGECIFKSKDGGLSWSVCWSSGMTVYSVAEDNAGRIFAGTGTSGTYVSTNAGSSWTQKANGLTNQFVAALIAGNNNSLYAGTRGDGVFRSTDGCESWVPANNGLTNLQIYALAKNSQGTIFCGTGGGMHRSTDSGNTWVKLTNGIPSIVVQSITVSTYGYIYAGTVAYVYFSADNGDTWQQLASGLGSNDIASIAVDPSGRVYAGTWGRGVFRSRETTLSPPSLSAPANESTGQPTRPILKWNAIGGALTYLLQVSQNSEFTSLAFEDPAIRNTSVELSELPNTTRFFWRIKALTAGAVSQFSPIWSFTTVVSAPATPSPIWPPYASVGLPASVVFQWDSVVTASNYQVQIGLDSLFANCVVNDSTLTGRSFQPGPLQCNTTYYWRVRAQNAGGKSSFSAVWNFKTTLAVPTLLEPPDGTSPLSNTPRFVWASVQGAILYRLQVSSDSLFATGDVDTALGDTSYTMSTSLSFMKQYHWRVRASNSEALGGWSQRWKLMILLDPPDIVSLISPEHNRRAYGDSVRFLWRKSSPEVDRYWFQIGLDSLFVFTFIDSTIIDTSTILRNLMDSQTYLWRVKAHNAIGWGPFSETRILKFVVISGAPTIEIPSEYFLNQNYPNPFNPSTTIRFGLPQRTTVTLSVFNTLGQLVAQLVNGEMEAGYHEVKFDASGLASGLYFYKLQAGDFVQTRKLLLVK